MKKTILLILGILLYAGNAQAALQLDYIQYDPAIIASGDEVDIIVQFTDDTKDFDNDRYGNSDYKFETTLEADDSLTEQYVMIQDSEGNTQGSIISGGTYSKVFRVKIMPDAPAGNYEFKLTGQWYFRGQALEGEEFLRFQMPVKKEGIILDIANIITSPAEVRPGDDYVKVSAQLQNVGEKTAKSVELQLETPEGISASYTSNNRIWTGLINAGSGANLDFYLDLSEDLKPGVYDLTGRLTYMDLDNNQYEKKISIPFLVKERPNIEVTGWKGTAAIGASGTAAVKIKNTGTESAEAVDVRIIKQNSQPFSIAVRSDYIGELEPGEEGIAYFDIKVNDDAEERQYDLKLLIRAKGDSDQGDDNIYTFDRRTKFSVEGSKPNLLLWGGIIALAAILIIYFWRRK